MPVRYRKACALRTRSSGSHCARRSRSARYGQSMTRRTCVPINPLSAALIAVACKNLIKGTYQVQPPPSPYIRHPYPRDMQLPEFDLERGTLLKEDNEPLPVQEHVYPPVKARPMRYGWSQTSFLDIIQRQTNLTNLILIQPTSPEVSKPGRMHLRQMGFRSTFEIHRYVLSPEVGTPEPFAGDLTLLFIFEWHRTQQDGERFCPTFPGIPVSVRSSCTTYITDQSQ